MQSRSMASGSRHHVHDVGGNRVTENWKSLGRILQSRTRLPHFLEQLRLPKPGALPTTHPSGPKPLPGLPDSRDHRGPAAVGDGRNFDLHGLGSPVPAPPENPTHHKKTIRLFAAIEPSASCPPLEACGGAHGAGSRTTSTLGRLASSCRERPRRESWKRFHEAWSLCEQKIQIRRSQPLETGREPVHLVCDGWFGHLASGDRVNLDLHIGMASDVVHALSIGCILR